MMIVDTAMAFGLGLAGAAAAKHFGGKWGLLDRPNERSSHSSVIPKGGGIGILAAFCAVAVSKGSPALWWVPAGALSFLSLAGDRMEVTPKLRLIVQFVAALAFLASLDFNFNGLAERVVAFLAFSVFLVGTANFYNFMDGINGISAITGIVGFSLIAAQGALHHAPPEFPGISLCMAAACLGFLPFNFPKAKVFMGDVGSVLLGFVFAALVVSLFRDLLDFVCLASYLFPFYVDELTTMVVRLKDGENLLNAHRRHVYQLLANEGGIPHWKVSLFYGFIQVLVGATVLWMRTFGGLAIGFLLGGYSVLSVFACIWVRRRYEGKGQRGSVRIVDKGQEK